MYVLPTTRFLTLLINTSLNDFRALLQKDGNNHVRTSLLLAQAHPSDARRSMLEKLFSGITTHVGLDISIQPTSAFPDEHDRYHRRKSPLSDRCLRLVFALL